MPEELNNGKINLEHRVTKLEVDSEYTKEALGYIKKRVDNHLPHQIEDINKKIDKFIESNRRQFISILISIIMLLLSALFAIIRLT